MGMQAMVIDRFGGREAISAREVPDPLVGPDGVLVRVRAAGVNPVDHKLREGGLAQRIPHFFPVTLGWDGAGTVERVGPAVVDFAPGDDVYGYFRKDFVGEGTYAELATMRSSALARRPRSLSFEEAGALPLAGLTALQLLREGVDLQQGETVLIHGASGGVGSFAVQIARAWGARVIASSSAANHDYLRGLGVEELIDYREQDFVEVVGDRHPEGIDAVIDLVGGDTQERSAEILQEGRGRLASVISPPEGEAFARRRLATRYIFVTPDAQGLRQLADMAVAGALRVHLHEVLSLEEAPRAHELLEEGHTRGKVVLRVP